MLRIKHLETRPLSAASLDMYLDHPLEIIPVDITKDTMTKVAGRLSEDWDGRTQ